LLAEEAVARCLPWRGESRVGDLNNDGRVNLLDLSLQSSYWRPPAGETTPCP
jgi:dockerin type I repeat protein